ncbi:MAG: hypothetical protein WAM91_12015 [Candidatus Acidiferrales bacterium]
MDIWNCPDGCNSIWNGAGTAVNIMGVVAGGEVGLTVAAPVIAAGVDVVGNSTEVLQELAAPYPGIVVDGLDFLNAFGPDLTGGLATWGAILGTIVSDLIDNGSDIYGALRGIFGPTGPVNYTYGYPIPYVPR